MTLKDTSMIWDVRDTSDLLDVSRYEWVGDSRYVYIAPEMLIDVVKKPSDQIMSYEPGDVVPFVAWKLIYLDYEAYRDLMLFIKYQNKLSYLFAWKFWIGRWFYREYVRYGIKTGLVVREEGYYPRFRWYREWDNLKWKIGKFLRFR